MSDPSPGQPVPAFGCSDLHHFYRGPLGLLWCSQGKGNNLPLPRAGLQLTQTWAGYCQPVSAQVRIVLFGSQLGLLLNLVVLMGAEMVTVVTNGLSSPQAALSASVSH